MYTLAPFPAERTKWLSYAMRDFLSSVRGRGTLAFGKVSYWRTSRSSGTRSTAATFAIVSRLPGL